MNDERCLGYCIILMCPMILGLRVAPYQRSVQIKEMLKFNIRFRGTADLNDNIHDWKTKINKGKLIL